MQPVLVQRPEVGDPRDEDVADGVKLDVADLLHLAGGADDFERSPLAPVPEVELVVSGDDEELLDRVEGEADVVLVRDHHVGAVQLGTATRHVPDAYVAREAR